MYYLYTTPITCWFHSHNSFGDDILSYQLPSPHTHTHFFFLCFFPSRIQTHLISLYLISLLFICTLLPPYNLDVPSSFTNGLRYCAVLPKRIRIHYRKPSSCGAYCAIYSMKSARQGSSLSCVILLSFFVLLLAHSSP